MNDKEFIYVVVWLCMGLFNVIINSIGTSRGWKHFGSPIDLEEVFWWLLVSVAVPFVGFLLFVCLFVEYLVEKRGYFNLNNKKGKLIQILNYKIGRK